MNFSTSVSSFLLLASLNLRADITVQSGPARVHLLELYTSEGCSSCPPAERWFSALAQNTHLWKRVVPLAFHVDYWDNLGWKDRLAAPGFTARQRTYAAAWGSGTVYTPGFVLDGREWRERDLGDIVSSEGNAGVLSATWRENGEVLVSFKDAAKGTHGWQANAALLGFGLSSDVKSGENGGRKLSHDFVVLDHQTASMTAAETGSVATLHLPLGKAISGRSALAVWITEAGKSESVQAAGGPL